MYFFGMNQKTQIQLIHLKQNLDSFVSLLHFREIFFQFFFKKKKRKRKKYILIFWILLIRTKIPLYLYIGTYKTVCTYYRPIFILCCKSLWFFKNTQMFWTIMLNNTQNTLFLLLLFLQTFVHKICFYILASSFLIFLLFL